MRAVRMGARPGPLRQSAYFLLYRLRAALGQKGPLLGGVKLTHDCNLSCLHCPFRQRKGPSLSYLQALSSLRALHSLGVRILIFEGGEPFLWRDGGHDQGSVVEEAQKLFFSVGVTTNGTFPIEAKPDIVWVSIDGLPETHDRGSYNEART